MKKAILLFLCLAVLFLTACGKPSDVTDTTAATAAAESQTHEPFTAEDRASANDTYGQTGLSAGLSVRDESVLYRTQDSYRYEAIAVRAAADMLRGSLAQPDSLQIADSVVSACADDGACVYYDVSFSYSYAVASGERVDSGGLYSVGVRKEDETAFDASDRIRGVIRQYSVFRNDDSLTSYTPDADEKDAFTAAAGKIALSHLKDPASGKVLSVSQQSGFFDPSLSVFDVFCEGTNDFDMRIPQVYTAYLVSDDGIITEVNPSDPNANNF